MAEETSLHKGGRRDLHGGGVGAPEIWRGRQ